MLKVDVFILDDVQMNEADGAEVETSEVVSEQGTTVVIVVIRSVVNVLLAVSGQSVTLPGHFVMVSVSVDMIVEVVESADVVRAPIRVLLLLYVPSVAEP